MKPAAIMSQSFMCNYYTSILQMCNNYTSKTKFFEKKLHGFQKKSNLCNRLHKDVLLFFNCKKNLV